MRKLSLLALVLVVAIGLAAGGCGKKAAAQLVTCESCGGKVEASMIKSVDGKQMCVACVEKQEAAAAAKAGGDQAAAPACVVCGMKMAKADMFQADGKWYCKHCAPAGATPGAPQQSPGAGGA